MKKILVLVDQENLKLELKELIYSHLSEVDVISATNRKTGVKLAISSDPQIIILEIENSENPDYEILNTLKTNNRTKHIPIVIIGTSEANKSIKSKVFELGAEAFISKPIDAIELAMHCKVLLRLKNTEESLQEYKRRNDTLTKKKSEVLEQNNKKYETIYFNAPLPYQSLNNEGNIIDINPAWLKALGYDQTEVIGRNFSEFLHDDFKDIFRKRFEKFKRTGHVQGAEFKVKHKNGSFRDISFVGNIAYTADGKVKQTCCVFNDITENKKNKDKIIESQEYYKALIENSTDYISIVDAEGKLKAIGDLKSVILGYSPEEIIGKSVLSLVHPDDKSRLQESFFKLINGESVIKNVNFRFKHKDGSWRYLEGTGKNMFDHELINGIVLNYRDNSDKLKVEKERNDTQRKLQTLINNLQGIAYICQVDDSWTMNYLSAGFEPITGYKTEDLIDNKVISFEDLIHPDDREYVREEVMKALDNKRSFEIQYRIIHKNGNIIHVGEKGMGVTDLDDGSVFIEGFINDMSSFIIAEKEIQKLNTVVRQSLSQIVITDAEGTVEYVNPKFTETTGYSSDEAIGQKSNILKSGKQSEEVYADLWDTISDGKIWRGEFQNCKKNGEFYWEDATISPIVDDEGNVTNYFKIANDITTEKHAEIALKESEYRYKKLIDTTSEGFWIIDQNAVTIDVNKSLCEIIGYTKEEIIGLTPYDFVDEENKKVFISQLAKANSNLQRKYEISLRSKSGTNIPTRFVATTINDNEGKFIGSFAFVSDISEAKRSEKIQRVIYNISNAISTTENLNTLIGRIQKELGTIIDTTNFFIALYDKESKNLTLPFFTDQKDKIVTIPARKSLTDYVIKTEKPLLANEEIKNKLEKEGEIERYGSSSKVWLGVPLKFNNEVIGVLVVQSHEDENAFDLDDMKMLEIISHQVSISINRKKNEDKIAEALEKAKESDRLKTAFLQNISHEIRTPMNGILGFTGLLKDPDLSSVEQQSYLDVIMVSGLRMLNTLNDIMDISMLETGQVNLNIGETIVNNELDSLYDLFKLEVDKKGLEIVQKYALPEQKVIINTDRDKFYTIFSNLIKNAIKYTSKGSIEYGYNIVADDIIFYVKDTGIGIPENRISAIFDRFVQADIEDVKVHEGSGLGLSISKAYLELMGGKIWVESNFGEGSKFSFSLPYNFMQYNEINFPEENKEKMKKKLKILIAEDEEFASEYLGIILEQPDNELLYAYDGESAVSICRQHTDIDLILMDIKLPILNGYDATKAIRTFNTDVIIIAQTAYALSGDKQKATNAGCNDYITKPINRDRLLQLIDKYIQ